MREMVRTEFYLSMGAKFQREAESQSDPMTREKLLTQADGWHWLATASRYISEKQADTQEMLAAIKNKIA